MANKKTERSAILAPTPAAQKQHKAPPSKSGPKRGDPAIGQRRAKQARSEAIGRGFCAKGT